MIIVQHLLMTKIKIKLLRVPDVFVTLFSIQFDQTVCLYTPPPSPLYCGIKRELFASAFVELVRGQGSLVWVHAICHDSLSQWQLLEMSELSHKWVIFQFNGCQV